MAQIIQKLKTFFENKRNRYAAGIIVGIVILISVLVLTGVLKSAALKKFVGKEEVIIEPDEHLMTVRNAYDIALLRAKEWKTDAKLANIKSFERATGPNGRSDNWNLLFVSPSLEKKGFQIIIENKEIIKAEEIFYTGTGADLPENIISSKEAINIVHQIKGYENEPIISVEMIYGPDGSQWYWGVKTSKGTARVNAKQ